MKTVAVVCLYLFLILINYINENIEKSYIVFDFV